MSQRMLRDFKEVFFFKDLFSSDMSERVRDPRVSSFNFVFSLKPMQRFKKAGPVNLSFIARD
jgi:hypothetical protein